MQIFEAAPDDGPSLALHGGAGGRVEELTLEGRAPYADGLQAAYSRRMAGARGGRQRAGRRLRQR